MPNASQKVSMGGPLTVGRHSHKREISPRNNIFDGKSGRGTERVGVERSSRIPQIARADDLCRLTTARALWPSTA
jgi:hypothetical protein